MSKTTHTTPSPAVNVIAWFEIPVLDIARSEALYEAMLDTRIEITDFGGVPHAVMSNQDHTCVSGALLSDPKRPPRRGSSTVIYLAAPDGVASCLARALEAGATLVQPRTEIGPHGAIALVEDLDGNVIGLHENPKP